MFENQKNLPMTAWRSRLSFPFLGFEVSRFSFLVSRFYPEKTFLVSQFYPTFLGFTPLFSVLPPQRFLVSWCIYISDSSFKFIQVEF